MKLLDIFNSCASPGYMNTFGNVSWKYDHNNKILNLECSRQPIDWLRNLLLIPILAHINGMVVIIPIGLYLDFLEIYEVAKIYNPEFFVGYSTGADLAALLGFVFGKKAYSFGCPNFLLFPSKKVLNCFDNVVFIQTDNDIVSNAIPLYRKGNNVKLIGRTDDITGHEAKTYRKLLGGMNE